jgi:CheY-like chemotaxis protein
MRIIYVEDNDANIALVERICNMSKDELLTYDNADTALAAIDPQSADLILMDINLGNHSINGLELITLLRRKGVTEPIVLITAYDPNGYPNQFETSEYNDYVPKPVSITGMLELLDAYRV